MAPPGGYLTALHARWLAEAPDRRWREQEGTLLFADVSGFTKLGEKLARKGKVGSEELTDIVNTVFAGMLGEVRTRGGEILKFGGDAVLAFFAGERHQLRGAAAGLGMQAMLRRLRRDEGLNLRLSAGVASGTVHLFLAGGTPRELIVAGPLASTVTELEAAAEAGQVLASLATARDTPSSLWDGRCGPGVALRGSPPPTPAVAPPVPPDPFDPRPGLPLHLHDHVPGDAEHRPVTVGFVQFKGTDAVLAEQGPAALARAIDDVVGSAADAAVEHGITFVGTDVDRDAGKIILAAGAPTAARDDDDRMLHALRAIVAAPRTLAVRAGVNRGRVFTVDIGTEQRRTWTVMGDAVNLAARVMGRSDQGTVLATQPVLARLHDEFARDPVPPFTVKGKSQPVFAEQVGEVLGASRSRAPHDAPLIGREQELETLRAALEGARGGEYRIVEIVGEPGMGKSRLVESVAAATESLPVVTVRGGPYSAHSPYRAVQGPLRHLLGCDPADEDRAVERRLHERAAELDPRLRDWLPLVGIPFGLDLPATEATAHLSPEFARARLNAWTGRLVDRLLPDGPSVLLIEDAHWLDEASSDLLLSLMRARRPGGVLVVTTRTGGEGGLEVGQLPETEVLVLEPLSTEAAHALVFSDEDAGALPPGVEERLVERAAGNPLLLQELVTAARAGESVDALPDSVEALVTARIDTLPRSDRRLLREASVLGSQVSVDLMTKLLERDGFAVQSTLRRLDDFLMPSGAGLVRFRHTLLRDAAYEGLPFRRRRELHARAARIIEREAGADAEHVAELLALHAHAAHDWTAAWRWARVAGEQALRRAAPLEAAGFLRRALEAGRALHALPAAELAAAAEALGDAAAIAGHEREASTAYEEALRRARGMPVAEATLCRKIGRLREKSRTVTQALSWYTRGLRRLEGADEPEAAAVRASLTLAHGGARMRAGRLREALPYLERALDQARACDARPTIAHAAFLLDGVLTDLGSPDAHRYRDIALPIYEELEDFQGQSRVLCNLGIDAYYEGRWDEAVSLYERSRAASERVGDVVEAAFAVSNIAEILSDQGRLEESERMLRAALHDWRAASYVFGIGVVHGNLGRLYTRRGELEPAERELAAAKARFQELGGESFLLEMDAREAERLLAAGRPAEALELVGRVRASAQALGAPPTLLASLQRIAGFAKLQLGDAEAACVRMQESLEIARSIDAAYEEALALDGLSRTGSDDAEEAARRAAEIFSRLGIGSPTRA